MNKKVNLDRVAGGQSVKEMLKQNKSKTSENPNPMPKDCKDIDKFNHYGSC